MRSIASWILGFAVAGTCLPALAGEQIIFSNRAGRKVVFDYSRSVRLLPPEIEEGGFNRSAAAGSAALMPFGDPAMSPSALRRRKTMRMGGGNRDWIFSNPKNEEQPGEKETTGFEEKDDDSAMVKFMKGEKNGATGQDREDLANPGNQSDHDLAKRKRRGLDFRELSGVATSKITPLEELETEAGFTPAIEGQPELTRFLKADFRRREDARHRQNMNDFRARLAGPSRTPAANVFGGAPAVQGVGVFPPGQNPISMGINSDPLVAPGAQAGGFPGARLPGAFESRSTPLNANGENAFNQTKERRFKRKPIDMSIRKRDF